LIVSRLTPTSTHPPIQTWSIRHRNQDRYRTTSGRSDCSARTSPPDLRERRRCGLQLTLKAHPANDRSGRVSGVGFPAVFRAKRPFRSLLLFWSRMYRIPRWCVPTVAARCELSPWSPTARPCEIDPQARPAPDYEVDQRVAC